MTAAALVLSACTTGSGGGPADNGSTAAAAELTKLAANGAQATYTATYVFHQVAPNSTATVHVWHAPPPDLRVDVVSGLTTASLIRTAKATFSCAQKGSRRTCFTVAGAGQKAPAPFDVGPAALFSDDLETLSASGASYVVTPASRLPASDGAPAAACFAIRPGLLTPLPAVQKGTYCFADDGVLTSVTYPSGNTAHLTEVTPSAPPEKFAPYASPAPLPR
jgi:hypothetical protein